MPMTVNISGQVGQIKLSSTKALWPLFETIINSIQSLEDSSIIDKIITIEAIRSKCEQLQIEGFDNKDDENIHFESFVVTDNGDGFNSENYSSFLEAYSQLKIKKGCKGIGRFLWLKAFEEVTVESIYVENDIWQRRVFNFTLNGVNPEENNSVMESENEEQQTIVTLKGFKNKYRCSVTYSLESLAKKVIEHCLPYFITEQCPKIVLKDNLGEKIILNDYYKKTYKSFLFKDEINFKNRQYILYHMFLSEGIDKHELHLCANSREVKSYNLSNYIPDLNKKITKAGQSCYYVGYLVGEYLDEAVNTERSDFEFEGGELFGDANESEIVDRAVKSILNNLIDELSRISDEKKSQIDMLVKSRRPQYRLLLNKHPEIYAKIPSGLNETKLDLELYKHQQQWEREIAESRHDIEEKVKNNATTDPGFRELFDKYCENITDLSRASLAEYVIRRKSVLDLLEEALETNANGKYSKESRIHSIICPMQTTSDETKLDDMNLWLIDDRLSYHHFLASDKGINKIPVLENSVDKRMDLAVFDAALSYTADPDNINSITIVELKRPQRDDSDNDPVGQVLKYVKDIKDGKIKKANGRDFGDLSRVSFYCYVIADLTKSIKDSAESRGLMETQDKGGFFGYNQPYGAYIEVISYDKLLKDAKQRNRALFDKLFEPKAKDLLHPELL